MRIGYVVQGDADEAVVRGLVDRWCQTAESVRGMFRGQSGESLRRELPKALHALRDQMQCDLLVVLTDADNDRWQDVKRREWTRVPADCQDICLFGVADRNIECWLAADRNALSEELGCSETDIPREDPSGFVKRRFGLGQRDDSRENAKQRIARFVAAAPLKNWISNAPSFNDFYQSARALAGQRRCEIPNELQVD